MSSGLPTKVMISTRDRAFDIQNLPQDISDDNCVLELDMHTRTRIHEREHAWIAAIQACSRSWILDANELRRTNYTSIFADRRH